MFEVASTSTSHATRAVLRSIVALSLFPDGFTSAHC
jgi:hypothetical protein